MRPCALPVYALAFAKTIDNNVPEPLFYFHDLDSFLDGTAKEYTWKPLTDDEFNECSQTIYDYLEKNDVKLYQELHSENGQFTFLICEVGQVMSDGSPMHIHCYSDEARSEVVALVEELFPDNKDADWGAGNYEHVRCFLENTIRDAEWLMDDISKSKIFIAGFLARYRDYFINGGELRYNRYNTWCREFVCQNQKRYLDIMNKDRRNGLRSIINLLNGVLPMTKKSDAVQTLETALRDIELAKDEEEMAKDSLPDNFFLTERYGNMEDNVNDLYDAIGTLEDVIEDVKSLSRFSHNIVKEPINQIIKNLETVIDR